MKTSMFLVVTGLCALGVLLCAGGCGSKKGKNSNTAAGAAPEAIKGTAKVIADDRSKCASEGHKVENLDLNHDTVPDVKEVYATVTKFGVEKEVMICREADLNFDGRKDIIRYFSDEGRPLREELDMDFDGKIDLVNYFEDGKVIKQEMDSNFDGLVDIWNFFAGSKLVRSERDSNADGTADIWEHYKEGKLARIGYDTDGDGKVDHWERSEGEEGDEGEGTKPPAAEGTQPPAAEGTTSATPATEGTPPAEGNP